MCSLLALPVNPNKLRFPRSQGTVGRPRVRQLLALGESCKLTLISAGAGFGKTTALADYLDRVPFPAIQYRLDWGDNDLVRFLTHLVEAVRSAYPEFGRGLQGAAHRLAQIPSGRVALADLLGNRLAALHAPLAIALDDFQCLSSTGDVSTLIAHLLEFPAPGVRLLVATRALPHLPISRLRARGDLHLITASELAFTVPELEALMACHGLRDPASPARAIHQQTEGWPAGVVMLLQVLRHRGDAFLPELLQGSRLSETGIYEYLADEVLRAQPPHVRAFLLKTSILRQLEVDLCDRLLERGDSAGVFDYLKEHGLFTRAVAAEPAAYRYHQLFRSFLEFTLAREYPSREVAELHVRAGHCFERRGEPDEAIRHFIAGRRLDLAARIAERVGEHHVEMGMLDTLEQWCECLAAGEQLSPKLRALRALARARRHGQFLPAVERLEAARARFAEAGDREGLVWASTHVASLHYKTGSYAQGIATLRPLADGAGALSREQRAQVLRALCDNYRGLGELESAVARGREALDCALEMPNDYRKSQIARALAQSLLHQGNLEEALRIVRFALELDEGNPEQFGDFELASVLCLMGIVHALRGDDAAAMAAFDRTEAHMGHFAAEHWSCMNLWRGNVERDRDNFAAAQRHYGRVPAQSLPEQSFLQVRQGDAESAVRLAREALVLAYRREHPAECALAELAHGVALREAGALPEGAAALERSLALFRRVGRLQHQLSAGLHLFAARHRMGEAEAAPAALRQALRLGRTLRAHHFPLWDPGVVLLAHGQAASRNGEDGAYLDRLRHAVRQRGQDPTASRDAPAEAEPAGPLAECRDEAIRDRLATAVGDVLATEGAVVTLRRTFGLTWREIDVFVAYYLRPARYGLASGETRRRHCADELCITGNTLKRHVGSIRQKLDLSLTGSHLHLLQWARSHGLVE